jgi:hypothetical protein
MLSYHQPQPHCLCYCYRRCTVCPDWAEAAAAVDCSTSPLWEAITTAAPAAASSPAQASYLSLLTQLTSLQVDPALLPEGSSGAFSKPQQLQKLVL